MARFITSRHSGGTRDPGDCETSNIAGETPGAAISKLPLTVVGGGTPVKHS
jgi:hypothetical protein